MKMPGSLVVVLLALSPARAQEGPSFDCGQAGTLTERAICVSPELARLERGVVAAYDDLVGRIGRREARAFADEQLALRQACGSDGACIRDRLLATTRAFEARGRDTAPFAEGTDLVAAALRERDPSRGSGAPAPSGPIPRPVARPATGAAADDDARDAFTAWEPVLTEDELARGGTPPGPLEPDPAWEVGAAPGPALSEAFLALPAYQRANLQGRLAAAGYGDPEPDGTWTLATAAALSSLLLDSSAAGLAFDPTTPDGAAALFDFIDSDRFKRDILGEEIEPALSTAFGAAP